MCTACPQVVGEGCAHGQGHGWHPAGSEGVTCTAAGRGQLRTNGFLTNTLVQGNVSIPWWKMAPDRDRIQDVVLVGISGVEKSRVWDSA